MPTVQLDFSSTGNAPQALKDMARDSRTLAEIEATRTQNLQRTVQRLEDEKRLRSDLAAIGYGPQPDLTADERRLDNLKRTIDRMKEAKQLKADLEKAGYGPEPPKTVQEKAADVIKSRKEKAELDAEVEKQSPSAPPKTLKERASDSIKAQKEQAALQKEITRQGGGRQGGGPIAGAMDEMFGTKIGGMLGKIAGPAAMATAAIALTTQAFQTMTQFAGIANNSLMTQAQKNRALGESIPIIGGVVKAWHELQDELDGTVDKIRMNAHHLQMVQIALTERAAVESGTFGPRQEFYAAAAGHRAEQDNAYVATAAPKDVLDDRQMRQFGAQQSLASGLRKAQMQKEEGELMAGMAARRGAIAERESRGEERKGYESHDSAVRLRNKEGGGDRNEKAINTAATEAQERYGKSLVANAEAQRQIGAEKQGIIAKLNAELALSNNLVDKDKERLTILRQQEGELKSAAAAIGGMNQGEKLQALTVAQQYKTHGFDSLTQEQQQIMGRTHGELLARERLKKGDADPLSKELQGLYGEKGAPENLADARKKIVAMETKVDVQVSLNEAAFKKALAEAMATLDKRIEQLVKDAARVESSRKLVADTQKQNEKK